jgi:hypothetical protein
MKKCTNPSRVATDSGSQSSAIESSSPASWPRMRSTENPPTTGRRPAGCMCETTRRSFRLQSSDLDPLPSEPRSLALSSSNGSVTQGLQIPTVVRIALSRNTGLLERSELLPTTAYDCPPMPALVGTKSAPGRPRRGSYLLSPVKFHRGPLPRSGRPESAPHRAEPTHLKTGQRGRTSRSAWHLLLGRVLLVERDDPAPLDDRRSFTHQPAADPLAVVRAS